MPKYTPLVKSQKKLTTHEVWAIEECIDYARYWAVEEEVAERLSAAPSGLTDCLDIAVRNQHVSWLRRAGDLFLIIRIVTDPTGRISTYKWRVPMRRVPYASPLGRKNQLGLTGWRKPATLRGGGRERVDTPTLRCQKGGGRDTRA